jgi:hypothetical protein
VDAVLNLTKPFNEAYEDAQKRKEVLENDESKRERLRKEAPDLADQITEERLSLAEALGACSAARRLLNLWR